MPYTNQYNWKCRKYRYGKDISSEFSEVVPRRVKLEVDYYDYYPYNTGTTPFRKVVIMPYHGTPELTAFLRSLEVVPQSAPHIWNEFKQSIFENWMQDKIHVIGASSGYDSRLIAKAIQELTKQHGRDWLGETYFVECAGEKEGFEAIMKRLGFKNYISWIPDYNFEYFENLHERFNGLCAYPMNQWYDYYVKNWNEDDIQYISGYGGNVADAMNPNSPYMGKRKLKHRVRGRLMMYFRKQYSYQLAAFRQPKHSFHPFWSWRYIRATAGVKHKNKRTSVWLANRFVPECNHIKRMDILGEVTKNGHRKVRLCEIKKLEEWYRSTEFGKRFPIQPVRTIEYNEWWLKLCIANYAQKNNISIR